MIKRKNNKDILTLQSNFKNQIDALTHKVIIALLLNNRDEIQELIGEYDVLFITDDSIPEKVQPTYNKFLEPYQNITKDLSLMLSDYEKEFYDIYSLSTYIQYDKFTAPWNDYFHLLFFCIQFISLEIYLPKEQPNRFESYVFHIKRLFEKFNDVYWETLNEKQKWILNILNDKLHYVLLKLDFLIPEKLDWISLKQLSQHLDNTGYKDIKNIIIFYQKDENDNINEISKIYLSDINKEKKKPLDYYFLAKYYKDISKNSQNELKEIYDEYKGIYSKSSNNMWNIIFLWNNLLSLYIRNNQWIKDENIEKLYQEIDNFQELWNKKNYFTYLKYAEYKITILSKCLSEKNVSKKITQDLQDEIKDLKNKIVNIYESWSFFELSKEENFIPNIYSNILDELPKIYSPNLIKISEKYSKDIRVERLQSKIEFLDFIISQNNSLKLLVDTHKKDILNQFNDSRNNQIEVLAIFSAIVLFVSGSIQLYTRLTDLKSAIVFTFLFAGAISIMLSLVFRTRSIVKWVNLIIWILLILFWIFSPKIITYNTPLNLEQWETYKQIEKSEPNINNREEQ